MHDRAWIMTGLVLFLALATFPMWRNLQARPSALKPALVLPAGHKDCVLPSTTMRASHMKLLLQWRDDVVRKDIRSFKAYDGQVYSISLSGTCLSCHSKAEFCDRCHSFTGVQTPYCWNCHIDPAQVRGRTP